MQQLLTPDAAELTSPICNSGPLTKLRMAKVATYTLPGDEKILLFENDHKWLMFLKEDNSEEVEAILESCDPIERERLVNGRFAVTSDQEEGIKSDPDDYDDPGQLLAQHPWSIAAVYGANKVLEVLHRFVVEFFSFLGCYNRS